MDAGADYRINLSAGNFLKNLRLLLALGFQKLGELPLGEH